MSRKKRYKHSESTKSKIRESNIKYWKIHSRKGWNNGFFGKNHTKKTKDKIKNSKYHKNLKGKDNPNFGNGIKLKGNKNPMKRKEVSKKVSQWRKTNQFGRKNPFFSKKHSNKSKLKMRTSLRKHHIYLIENSSEIMYLTASKHKQLHGRTYNYLYDRYGKKGINGYLKWFDKKYGLKGHCNKKGRTNE